MSMRPAPLPDPDPLVAAAIARKFRGKRKRPLAVTIRDRLGDWLKDGDFAAAFGTRGRPGYSPAMLALVSVLAQEENLTDREAADAAATRLDWQYLLGLGLDEPGFGYSVLSEFRTRLAEHGLEEKVLDALLARLAGEGLVKAGGKQRTDSTYVLSAARARNVTDLTAESVRAAIEALAVACPDWVAARLCTAEWNARYMERTGSWSAPRRPAGKPGEAAVIYARDGYGLLRACCEDSAPPYARDLDAVQVLRVVLLQNFAVTWAADGREVIVRREPGSQTGVPPARNRIASPYDTAARRATHGSGLTWLGYKLHVTETCDDPPACGCRKPLNLITGTATTDATVPDAVMTLPVSGALAARDLAPGRHYTDSGYASAENILASARDHGITLITPLPADYSRQAREAKGYDRTAFTIDYATQTVTCPQGKQNIRWTQTTSNGKPSITASFDTGTCRACPARPDCTSSKRGGRNLTLLPRELHEITLAARAAEITPEWRQDYKRRAGCESTISQAIAAGARRTPYHGLPKVRLQHNLLATALNLRRLDAYWNDSPFNRRRTTHFARLCQTLQLAALPPPRN